MKSKPIRHKRANTFVFESVAKRVARIDVDFVHKIRHPFEESDDEDGDGILVATYSHRCVAKHLSEPERSFNYDELRRSLPTDIKTLPQLLLQKDKILDALVTFIQSCDSESLQFPLELFIALTKDLGNQMYGHFRTRWLPELVRLSNTEDASQMELVFTCFASLFKYLCPDIVNDIETIFPIFLPLLSDVAYDYLQNIAAKTFSFVVRKIKQKREFLVLLLDNARNNNINDMCGMSKLIFEATKGPANQFHSCTEEYFTQMLKLMEEDRFSHLITNFVENYVNNISLFVSTDTNFLPFWNSIMNALAEFRLNWLQDGSKMSTDNLSTIFRLIKELIMRKNCVLSDPTLLVEFIILMLKEEKIQIQKTSLDAVSSVEHEGCSKLGEIIVDLLCCVLKSKKISKNLKNANEIVMKVVKNTKNVDLLMMFVKNLISVEEYEPVAVAEIVNFANTMESNDLAVTLLADMIYQKTQFQVKEETEYNLKVIVASLRNVSKDFIYYMLSKIRIENMESSMDEFELTLYSIIVLSYIENGRERFQLVLDEFTNNLCSRINKSEDSCFVAKLMYILYMCVQYSQNVANGKQILDCDMIVSTLTKWITCSDCICSLKILDIIGDSYPLSGRIDAELLINNLNSPFHKVRLLTSRILHKLNIHPLFEIILAAESIIPSIANYRDRLLLMQKLEHNEEFVNQAKTELCSTGVLKFLFGNLYINFMCIWKPTQNLIASHIRNSECASNLYEHCLNEAGINDRSSKNLMYNVDVNFNNDFLKTHFYDVNGVDDRVDYSNYRYLLLSVLTVDSVITNNINKLHLSNLLLDYYGLEYASVSSKPKHYINIKEEDDPTEDDEFEEVETTFIYEGPFKSVERLLILHLKVVESIKHCVPTNTQPDVYKIYFELLTNQNDAIREISINYLSYADKLAEFKNYLLRLSKDCSFKDALLDIRLDFNNETFNATLKPKFMNLVLKMLLGKMRHYKVSKSSKKLSSHNLRNALFEFLAGCEERQIVSFFDMIFEIFSSCIKDKNDPIIRENELVDFQNVISPSWICTYVNNVTEIFQRCGHLLTPYCLAYLLRILIRSMAITSIVLRKKEEVQHRYYGIWSKVKSLSFGGILEFFENFHYTFSSEEINSIFMWFVDPWIINFKNECLVNQNALMKLFIIFSGNPRYYPLLNKETDDTYPLRALVSLLKNKKVTFHVKTIVMEAVERLLTTDDTSESDELRIHDRISSTTSEGKQQYGVTIILPHIELIINYLQSCLTRKNSHLNLYLLILKKICELKLNEEHNLVLISLLIPLLHKKMNMDDDVLLPLLNTVSSLFKSQATFNDEHVRKIAFLIGNVTSLQGRKTVYELLEHVDKETNGFVIYSSFITGLNARDKKWIEQPDYTVRLDTFRQIKQAVEKNELNLTTGIFLIHNCFYTIKMEKDIALRDNAAMCVKNICLSFLEKLRSSDQEMFLILVIALIRDGIKSSNENYRYESVMLLGYLVRECKDKHPILKSLFVLCDKEDPENDFFENILHLQIHNRTKVISRFCQIMSQQLNYPNYKSFKLIMPLISMYLLNSDYAKNHGLVSASIEAVRIICCLSPWEYYEEILKMYLLELGKQSLLRKQAIRIISSILSAFHYDIQKASTANDQDTAASPRKSILCLENTELIPAVKRKSVLRQADALSIYTSIRSSIVPSLDRVFLSYEEFEKHNKKTKEHDSSREEIATSSIPIALAIVKLLKQLPPPILDDNIDRLFLKLSTYLKSRLPSIRLTARETMQDILLEIGPQYLPNLLSQMMSILKSGFQIHVLIFTCHAILEKLEPLFVKDQLDSCVQPIVEMCIVDLFGKVSEEKDVAKIVNKTPEAKGNKSYNMLVILSKHISEKRMLDLVLPLKEIISSNLSSKLLLKVQKWLHSLHIGFTHNIHISPESRLIFAYGVANECIPELINTKRKRNTEKSGSEQEDCYLLKPEPKSLTSGTTELYMRSNNHVLVEFGLEILESLLKREIVKHSSFLPHLDPFIPLISDCLNSTYMRLTIISLKCLTWLLKRDLPSLNSRRTTIMNTVFSILVKHSNPELTGEGADLMMATTKVALVYIRELDGVISNDQLRIMIYVCEDLLKNLTHFSTGFSILRAIIDKKYNIPEVHGLLQKVKESSITSKTETIRSAARKAFLQYMMDYPMGRKLNALFDYYLSQLDYSEVFGRKSALEMIRTFVNKLPLEIVLKFGSKYFIKLASTLMSDDDASCKKLANDTINDLISKVQNTEVEEEMFNITSICLKMEDIPSKRKGCLLLCCFIEVKKESFSLKLKLVLPVLENFMDSNVHQGPGKFMKAIELDAEKQAPGRDYLLFQAFKVFSKITECCPKVFTNHMDHVKNVFVSCKYWLRSPHDWIRLAASEAMNYIFKSINPSAASECLGEYGTIEFLKSLCLDLRDQVIPSNTLETFLEIVMKNLLYLTEVFHALQMTGGRKNILTWLVHELVKQVYYEVSKVPQSQLVRKYVFLYFEELSMKFVLTDTMLQNILPPLLREISIDSDVDQETQGLAKRVFEKIRKQSDSDCFNDIANDVQKKITMKRIQRRTELAQMVVKHPEKAAKLKLKKQLKKKAQKKKLKLKLPTGILKKKKN